MNLNSFLSKHPIFEQTKLIQEICRPLRALGITFFSHAHLNTDQTMTCLSTSADFSARYFEKKYFQVDLHHRNTQKSEEYILWDLLEPVQETRELENDFLSFQYGHTFSIARNHGDSKDFYHFATELGNERQNQVYLEHLNDLKKFILHFHDEVQRHPALRRAYQQKSLSLSKDCQGFQIVEQPRSYTEPSLSRIAIKGGNTFLSIRECECLHWLSLGKTHEEVAMILDITPRTVKAHINNMKTKLGCTSLFQLGMVYHSVGINPSQAEI